MPAKWLVSMTVLLGALMAVIDTSIVNVAMPHMAGGLGVGIDEITWVAISYMVANVIVMPLIYFFSQRFGRRRFYFSAVLVFTLASGLCGMARTLPEMIAFRALQGFGGGVLIPTAQAFMMEVFPPGEQGFAMAIFGMAAMAGPAIGPVLGGWITDNYGWPWIYLINIPIGIATLLLVPMTLPADDPKKRVRARTDFLGIGLLAVALSCLDLVLERGQRWDWFNSALTYRFGILGVLSLFGFIYWELKAKSPAVELRVMKNFSFSMGTAMGTVLMVCLYANNFVIPVWTQELLGFDATHAGLAVLPRALIMFLVLPATGRLYNLVDPRITSAVGFVIMAASGLMLKNLSLDSGISEVFWPLIVWGLGNAAVWSSLTTLTLSAVNPKDLVQASGIYNLIRQFGGSTGYALVSTLSERRTQFHRSVLIEHLSQFSPIFRERWGTIAHLLPYGAGSTGMPPSQLLYTLDPYHLQDMALAVMNAQLNANARMMAYADIFWLFSALFLVSAPFFFLIRNPHKRNRP